MTLFRVFNGFQGFGAVCVLCEAETEFDARNIASKIFHDERPNDSRYWDGENFSVEIVTLPELGESS